MNALSVDVINASVPYKVSQSKEEGFFDFITTHGVHYSVGFMKEDLLMNILKPYKFSVKSQNNYGSNCSISYYSCFWANWCPASPWIFK